MKTRFQQIFDKIDRQNQPGGNVTQIRRAEYQGREFTLQADSKWLDDWGRELKATEDGLVIEGAPDSWVAHSLARWADQDIPERRWFMADWIPLGQVVSLYGRPGARKSTLLLQLMIASVLGRGFGPCPALACGPCYGLFCEDDEFEIARRARAVLAYYGARFSDMQDCHPESLVGATLTTFVAFKRSGVMITTAAWDQFQRDLNRFQPVFVVLDVGASFFGGNEINRNETGQFLSLLDRTANERGFALVLSAHPSLRGMADHTLTSGSTGWEGGVRARMTIEDPTDDDKDENGEESPLTNQSDRRILTLAKSNYARSGEIIDLVIRNGVFIPAALDPETQRQAARGPADRAEAETVFLQRLKDRLTAGRSTSVYKNNGSYAPTILAGDGFPMRALEAAMERLFACGALKIDTKARGIGRWIIDETKR